VVVAELRPAWTAARAIAADAGRIARNPDLPAADVSLALFDIPDVLEQGSATPIVLLAASSPSHTWKSHAVELSAGQQILQVQTARRKTFLGTATTVLGAGDASLIDDVNSFDVQLIDPEQWLVSCDDDAIAEGGNLAVLGSEVLQFGRAEPIGAGAFRLSHLVRGCAGTEWAMSFHSIGEPFAMIARDTLQSVSLPSWSVGATVAASIGVSSCTPTIINAEGLRPVAPVHLNASIDSAGNLVLSWTRRSRNGFAWNDEVDVPLGESSELYRVRISGAGGSVELPVTEPSLQVPSADLAPIGVGPISIEVRQVGDACASKPARTMIN
jgi:hypothetical protein